MLDKATFVDNRKDELPDTVPVAWDHAHGPLDAQTVLIFYGAYACPRARRMWIAVRRADDRSTVPVRLICRPLPGLSPHSLAAALLSERAAARGHFWTAHESMISNAELDAGPSRRLNGWHLSGGAPSSSSFAAWDRIADHARMARLLGLGEGPALFVNGLRYTGAPESGALALALESLAQHAHSKPPDGPDRSDASRVLSVVSHELRGALSPLLLALSPTAHHAAERALPEEVRTRLEIARRQVRVLSRHLEHLTDTHAGQAALFQPRPLRGDLVPIVRAALAPFRRNAAVRGPIRLSLDADDRIEGSWDPMRIEQIVVNLVGNALKYAGGKPIAVAAKKMGPFVRLAVRDHGEGMSAEEVARLFRPHSRLDRHRQSPGIGLGLYIVRALAEAHHGRAFVVSERGQGSTFGVELPLLPAALSAVSGAAFAGGSVDDRSSTPTNSDTTRWVVDATHRRSTLSTNGKA